MSIILYLCTKVLTFYYTAKGFRHFFKNFCFFAYLLLSLQANLEKSVNRKYYYHVNRNDKRQDVPPVDS